MLEVVQLILDNTRSGKIKWEQEVLRNNYRATLTKSPWIMLHIEKNLEDILLLEAKDIRDRLMCRYCSIELPDQDGPILRELYMEVRNNVQKFLEPDPELLARLREL